MATRLLRALGATASCLAGELSLPKNQTTSPSATAPVVHSVHRRGAKLGIFASFVKALGDPANPGSVLNEMLCEAQSLRLVVGPRSGGAIEAVRHRCHRFIDKAADGLALLDQEGNVVRAHLKNSACAASARVGDAMTPGTHGSTFAGNPLAMAVAEVILGEVSAPGFLEDVNRRGAVLHAALNDVARRYPDAVVEVRGRGFLCGVRLADAVPAGDIVSALRAEHVLTVPAGENTVRFLPPLIVSEEEIAMAVDAFDRVLAATVGAEDG